MGILLSTIIPIYNKEKALKNTLQSIVDNHEIDDNVYECILVDDESTDSCPDICKEFCTKYPYFRYIRIFNNGSKTPSNARNMGMDISRGKYIHFMDADDTLCNSFYKKALDVLYLSEVDVFVRGYFVSDNDKGTVTRKFTPTDFKYGVIGPPLASCIFRNYIKELRFKPLLSQDVMFSCEALINHSYYDDTRNHYSFIYHKEFNQVNKHPLEIPFPKNVVKALQSNINYPYELRNGEVYKKIDKNKIVTNGSK